MEAGSFEHGVICIHKAVPPEATNQQRASEK